MINTTVEYQKENKEDHILNVLIHHHFQFKDLLTDDEMRIRIQFFAVYLIFCFVSFGMTVVNVMTSYHLLMWTTFIFGIASIINIILCLINLKTEKFSRILFSIEIILLFTSFAVFGEPEGFSIIWSVILPTGGLLLFRSKYGTIISAIQFVILIFLFWSSLGQSLLQYEYTSSFLLRFPLLYFSFFLVGIFFETVRFLTQKELVSTRSKFEFLYHHDALTGLYNRYGFDLKVNDFINREGKSDFAFGILDLDYFKNINDTYGHQKGDVVLKDVAMDITVLMGPHGCVARWGGEEFALLFYDSEFAESVCKKILEKRRRSKFMFNNETNYVTASIGLVKIPADRDLMIYEIITAADKNLYQAKNTGRDKMIISEIK